MKNVSAGTETSAENFKYFTIQNIYNITNILVSQMFQVIDGFVYNIVLFSKPIVW